MKEKLISLNWSCVPCSCPGAVGYDCANKLYKGVLIKIKNSSFKILKNGLAIDSGHNYELEAKLKKNEIF
jgi:hypothetical protein